MTDDAVAPSAEAATAWAKDRLDKAVLEIMKTGIFEGATVAARPVWTLPNKIVIGRARDSGSDQREFWIIAGDIPTDCVNLETCATPRDAARHFALKWQLGAEQIRDPDSREKQGITQDMDWETASDELASIAEDLYQVVEADQAWDNSETEESSPG